MLDTPQIVKTSAQRAAVIHIVVARAEIQKVMGPGMQEVMAAVAAQGIATAGPLFAHHLTMDPKTFEFEIGVPVAKPVAPTGRVKPGELPAATVARAIYRGPYEGLSGAWAEFGQWMTAEGHKAAADLWECYVTGPESGPDPSKWQTQLNRPLVSSP